MSAASRPLIRLQLPHDQAKLSSSKVPLPPANIHRMEGELDPEEAASPLREHEIRNTFKLEGRGVALPSTSSCSAWATTATPPRSSRTHGRRSTSSAASSSPTTSRRKIPGVSPSPGPSSTRPREVAFLIEGESPRPPSSPRSLTGPYDPERLPLPAHPPRQRQAHASCSMTQLPPSLPAPSNTLTAAGGSHRVGTLEL